MRSPARELFSCTLDTEGDLTTTMPVKTESNYSKKLRDPRWQKKRLEIMQRDTFACRKCGDTKSELHVHHIHYLKGKELWEVPNESLVTLCRSCHEGIESLKQDISPLLVQWSFSACVWTLAAYWPKEKSAKHDIVTLIDTLMKHQTTHRHLNCFMENFQDSVLLDADYYLSLKEK